MDTMTNLLTPAAHACSGVTSYISGSAVAPPMCGCQVKGHSTAQLETLLVSLAFAKNSLMDRALFQHRSLFPV